MEIRWKRACLHQSTSGKVEEKKNKAGGRSEEGGHETGDTLSSEKERAAKPGSDPTGPVPSVK